MPSWTAADIPDQTGRTVAVTGPTSGLGLASARALAAAGARVLLAGRDPGRSDAARADVAAVAAGPPPEVVACDLSDLASVRSAAAEIASRAPALDVLVNNAGVMALPLGRTAEGFELQMGTNHLGHFALTGLLLPSLLAAPAPRVVTTSSTMHRTGRIRWDDLHWQRGYQRWLAYGQSKLANLLFAFELDRRARAAKSTLLSAAAHPGYAATHLQARAPEEEGRRLTAMVFDLGSRLVAQSADDGALPQLYAATMPDVRGGEYLGPDGWTGMRGGPTRVRASAAARSEGDASRLWEVSERLTDVTFAWEPAGSG